MLSICLDKTKGKSSLHKEELIYMTNKKKLLGIREISIEEINKLNRNRSVWVNILLAQARLSEALIFPLKSKSRFVSKKENTLNKAIEALYHSSMIHNDTYYKLRVYNLIALFDANQYPEKSFLVEDYEKTESIKKEQVKVMKQLTYNQVKELYHS